MRMIDIYCYYPIMISIMQIPFNEDTEEVRKINNDEIKRLAILSEQDFQKEMNKNKYEWLQEGIINKQDALLIDKYIDELMEYI